MSSSVQAAAAGGAGVVEDAAIKVANLTKDFRVYERPFDRLRELCLLNRRRYHSVVRALSRVSFTVRRGESIGVIGRNGAGKTSLLSILTGTLAPTSGTVDVYGRVGAILGLGVGFLPQYSGRENLRNGLIARGLPPSELREKEAQVIEFSELDEMIDNPLRTYSAGMKVRLGFSLAACVDPDILIVDEALAVGDAAFQYKCQRVIRGFMEQGKTLFFVSHNVALLETICERGILLRDGRVTSDGPIAETVRAYRRQFSSPSLDEGEATERPAGAAGGLALVRAEPRDAPRVGDGLFEARQGDTVEFVLTVRTSQVIERPAITAIVHTVFGQSVCGFSTSTSSDPLPRIEPGEFTFEVHVPFRTRAGTYVLEVLVADLSYEPPRNLQRWEEACAVRVQNAGYAVRGAVDPGIELIYGPKTYSLQREIETRHGATTDSA